MPSPLPQERIAELTDSFASWVGLSSPGQQILAGILLAAVALVLFLGLSLWLLRVSWRRTESWAERRSGGMDPEIMSHTRSWLRNLLLLTSLRAALHFVPFGPVSERWIGHIFLAALTVTTISLSFSGFRFSLELYLRRRGSSLAEHKSRVLLPVVKGVAYILAAVFLLDNYGVEIGTIMAGLGVAGVAVGFAAQAVLGDLFSYFAILFDRPFQIGDFILVNDQIRGNIEHIGLKTSRIRSLDGEQIIISNTDLTSSRVKNYRRMTRRRAVFFFGVVYSTPHDVLAAIPGWVREIISEVPRCEFDRAHFFRFGDSSLDFEVVYFLNTPEYLDYMDAQQAIHLGLVRRFEQEGVDFAFPTRTVHLAGNTPPPPRS
ncbi:mechanosensitive ion channel family protein [Paucidesulfovibrio longus]|uniref:mechanosensitive ion channel family protein n=1 Tax=Paucidesulfovibrio longus TaxID=889 RepID=UPI000429C67D|nr:mechanosensitive ion channel family protein [Paucidesulfovibrio longus]